MISLVEFMSICGVARITAAGASQGFQLLRRSRERLSDREASMCQEEPSGRGSGRMARTPLPKTTRSDLPDRLHPRYDPA